VQDYHLALVGPRLCAQRDDVRTAWFGHTPFCWPDGLRPIPDDAATAFVAGIAGHHACGFHSSRWAEAFTACARQREVTSSPFVAPLGADADDLARVAESGACAQAVNALDDAIGDRRLLVRVDRIELSKNVLRGFHAFDELLTRHPEWRERVVFAAYLYPSREGLPEYLSYRQEVEGLARLLNDKWSTRTWTPILFDADDDFPRSVAALRRADVLLVNPIRDGLNLVAKEGVLVSERHCALVLSTEAGVWDELGAAGAIGVNPFDVGATATALHDALSMTDDERVQRHARLRAAAAARAPRDWLADQLAAATR
jgi:trehalose 6-phosphate synthase